MGGAHFVDFSSENSGDGEGRSGERIQHADRSSARNAVMRTTTPGRSREPRNSRTNLQTSIPWP